ncbi:bifunctional tetrahydrofolate synthase/dihydrofolate synthase [Pseudoalteromonas denitrificans]|uniref:Dihydrofolate synthase/folylpolyglutamate synthase n=1 Tax=Pseudoalteromonas denitrificans DSM 6059 TaxID=1123010 RepID=A0A1I1QPS5_9GAMM|nr:bifunctional tetrahydrofolate synthase/dihydrofolate synthase [Pseudoalteromonas denitrificans]SFD24035.1 dihydrofolate synthase / folylpolyglutamate synthase [Pseudoalteromonas denitrificans DSM 6059]
MSQCILSQSSSLDDWLCYLESIHPADIEMGLTRVTKVAQQQGLLSFSGKIILIAGTNGKGTTARCLEALLLCQGYSVGTYASPHIFHYNERVRVNGKKLDNQKHVDAFYALEKGRGETSLTYFEYATLAALEIFKRYQVDYILLEVGLGGRLDATNIVSPIASVITTIDLDHKDYLGDTRELVGFEKAGIFRKNIPAIVGDLNIPQSVIEHGENISADMILSKKDFIFEDKNSSFVWQYKDEIYKYSQPAIPAQNVATALTTLKSLDLLPDENKITHVLQNLKVEGRFECLSQSPLIYVDVAHNPESARYLAKQLQNFKAQGVTIHALTGMLEDKDQKAALSELTQVVDHWSITTLNCFRGANSEVLANKLEGLQVNNFKSFISVKDALDIILAQMDVTAKKDKKQLLIIFGSFYTVADAMLYLQK